MTFETLEDFLLSMSGKVLNKKVLEALIKSGAMDEFGERGDLLESVEIMSKFSGDQKEDENQDSLFGSSEIAKKKMILKKGKEIKKEEKLEWEKELLGMYISAHPLEEYREKIKDIDDIIDILEEEDVIGEDIAEEDNDVSFYKQKDKKEEKIVNIFGRINSNKTILTKSGKNMSFLEVEDTTSNIEVVVFPKVWDMFSSLLEKGNIIKVNGKIDKNGNGTKIIANNITGIDIKNEIKQEIKETKILKVYIEKDNEDVLDIFKKILLENIGENKIIININGEDREAKTKIKISDDLLDQIKFIGLGVEII